MTEDWIQVTITDSAGDSTTRRDVCLSKALYRAIVDGRTDLLGVLAACVRRYDRSTTGIFDLLPPAERAFVDAARKMGE